MRENLYINPHTGSSSVKKKKELTDSLGVCSLSFNDTKLTQGDFRNNFKTKNTGKKIHEKKKSVSSVCEPV